MANFTQMNHTFNTKFSEAVNVGGTNVNVDATLTVPGYAADAKATGDALALKLGVKELPNAVNDALAQAKASGEFDGEDGKDYVLTEEDKNEIAALVDLPDVPTKASQLENDVPYATEQMFSDVLDELVALGERFESVEAELKQNPKGYQTESQVNALINTALGDIETALDGIIAIQNELIGGDGV